MSPAELAARVLRVDTASIASVEAIKHGLTNDSWLVRTRDATVVVRISNPRSMRLQIDRIGEARILDVVATACIGPEVLACDLQLEVLVTRYLGQVASAEQMREPDSIRRLGQTLRLLHVTAPPPGANAVHLTSVIAGYLETLDRHGGSSGLTRQDVRDRALALAHGIATSSTPCLCHNDIHHLNVVDGERLRLIDWEYAGVGEPYFDLASACVYHGYTAQQRERLLDAYVDSRSPTALERLEICCELFSYVRDLWTAVRAL